MATRLTPVDPDRAQGAASELLAGVQAQLGMTPNDVREFKNDDGALLARYFFIQDPDGYKVEVLERHGHYQ